MTLIGVGTKPMEETKSQPIRVSKGARARLAVLLTSNPEMHGVGYTEFIERACEVAEREIEAEREQVRASTRWSLTEAERRVLKYGPSPGCPTCDAALLSLRRKILGD